MRAQVIGVPVGRGNDPEEGQTEIARDLLRVTKRVIDVLQPKDQTQANRDATSADKNRLWSLRGVMGAPGGTAFSMMRMLSGSMPMDTSTSFRRLNRRS